MGDGPFSVVGKEVLKDGKHYADVRTEENAAAIVHCMNKVWEETMATVSSWPDVGFKTTRARLTDAERKKLRL